MRQSLHLATRRTDPAELAHAHRRLALALGRRGDYRGARRHAERTLALYRGLHHPPWKPPRWVSSTGTPPSSKTSTPRGSTIRAALVPHRRHRNVTGEATALDCLNWIEHRPDRHDNAVRCYRQALVLVRDHRNTIVTVGTFDHLGQSLVVLGRHDRAREAWRQALHLYRRQGRESVVERIQRDLHSLPAGTEQPAR